MIDEKKLIDELKQSGMIADNEYESAMVDMINSQPKLGMNEDIGKARNLLENNGYVVKKWTRSMELDANECEEMESNGKSKDCCGCSCSVCLVQ